MEKTEAQLKAPDSKVFFQLSFSKHISIKSNKKTEKLIDQFVSGDNIIRDTIKAIGTDKIKPASFGIFYDDLENPKTGGTGHTMKVCEQNNIPIIDQSIWFKW